MFLTPGGLLPDCRGKKTILVFASRMVLAALTGVEYITRGESENAARK
ncbi:MAG: hypothetical protein O7A06_15830 [Acidobacteria bacterium]|nr:hypothetical protein [Acidobacteriota bacterium]